MTIRLPLATLFLCLVGVVVAALAFVSPLGISAAADISTLAVDTNTSGNTASGLATPHTETLGAIDACRTVANGATFDIDVVVNAVPTYDNPVSIIDHTGLGAFGFDLVYDKTVLKVTAANAGFLMKSGGTGYMPFSFTNSVPDSTGDFSVAETDLSTNYDSGAGVLERITLQAIGLGDSQLAINVNPNFLHNPQVLASDSTAYTFGSVLNGSVNVTATGVEPCVPVPTPVPGPPPTVAIGSANVAPGANVTVDLSAVAPPPGIGFYTIAVVYDHTLLSAIGCTSNPAGVCDPSFSPNAMRFYGDTAFGLVGNVTLGSLTLMAGPSPGQCSALTITVVELGDPKGLPLGSVVSNGQICIRGGATPTPNAVGGIVELLATGSDSPQAEAANSGSSTLPGALVGGTVLVIMVAGWYRARRWLR